LQFLLQLIDLKLVHDDEDIFNHFYALQWFQECRQSSFEKHKSWTILALYSLFGSPNESTQQSLCDDVIVSVFA